ncbi:Coenzyme F420 hydrogenase/dehydrogenase, beta subunit C-terminal domain [Sphingosinicella sp. CPCC 101087]|uniref:Coenzyme F420 hydrogenase/dehydrogenase, beta subunit C-terminal domain n=1 Tax=Sphingosinicella sp. CPCC 101087 TaxID=2497754 RepID=UPI00101DF816|nr:Coenzyme F420 hydrogenase/dehydrogenase, beta subunit C-terminal domain [Sphingosinicella sp. CPCC 101087]
MSSASIPATTRAPLRVEDVVSAGLCIGCGACAGRFGGDAQMRWDVHGHLKPVPESFGGELADVSRTCPFSPDAKNETTIGLEQFPKATHDDAVVGRFDAAYVGHVAQGGFREAGSSGGMVSWVAAELLRAGLVDAVAHVVAAADPQAEGRFFHYRLSRSEEAVRSGAKSRYYPVEMSDVIREVRAVPGRYAVVGIPCFIKAINLLRDEDPVLRDRIAFTLGLFCGHMKSARFVESFAWQMGVKAEEIARVDFRLKNPDRPANWYTAHLALRDGTSAIRDWWHLADGDWGAGFFQNSACDYCDDVIAETADISFGDAWVEPFSSDGRGTNVIVVRSPALHDLVRRAIARGRLDLSAVDARFIERTQEAGLRHRREGLAYRLAWLGPTRLRLCKRVDARARGLPLRRRLIYRMRHHIAVWSARMSLLAHRQARPRLYVDWARAALALYHGLAYSRGRFGRLADHVEAMAGRLGIRRGIEAAQPNRANGTALRPGGSDQASRGEGDVQLHRRSHHDGFRR